MNKCYRLVYNRCCGVWQAAAENVCGHGKGGYKKLLVASVLAGVMPLAQAEGNLKVLPQVDHLPYTTIGGVSANGRVMAGGAYDDEDMQNYRPVAYRWVEGKGMERLGDINNGVYALATAVSATGNVIVGTAVDGADNSIVAFRWVDGRGMESLGQLDNGGSARATGVNAVGNVVVGTAEIGSNTSQSVAFRWVEGTGMESLGFLDKGSFSEATGVNAVGNVVVGWADDGADSFSEEVAFRWVAGKGMESLGTLNNGSRSRGHAVNAAGNVVVGWTYDGVDSADQVAFRWVEGNGMESLGFLDKGSFSEAKAVNAAGNVVVGWGNEGGDLQNYRAFRWTEDSNKMQSVEAWLEDNGVTVAGTIKTSEATGVSADGNVVVGNTQDNRGFIARVGSDGSGMIDPDAVRVGLHRVAASGQTAQSNAELVLHGMHGNPLQMLLANGKAGMWTAGDFGRQNRESREGNMAVAELGFAYRLNDTWQFNVATGHTYSKADTDFSGRTRAKSNYVLPEVILTLPGSLYATVSVYYATGSLDVDRGYENAGINVLSKGSPDSETAGARVRFDWQNIAHVGSVGVTPYVGLSYAQTKIKGYTETGGGFPVRWDARTDKSTTGRVGLDLSKTVNERIKLQGRVEGVHRFEKNAADVSAEMLGGLGGFNVQGQDLKQTWLRLGAGLEGKLGSGVASAMVNATTEGETAAYWLTVGYRWAF